MEGITPQVVFFLFGIPIKSTIIATWIAMAIIILTVILLDRFKPHFLEYLVRLISGMIASIMNVNNVEKYVPFLGTLFIFLTVANILGILPVLSAPTSDINTTVALALVVLVITHYFGISKNGLLKYSRELATPIFLLPLEIIGQISRTISLSLRLFGNILSGELIVAIVFSLVPLLVPLPLVGLSLLISILQAYVFTALSSVYIASAVDISEN